MTMEDEWILLKLIRIMQKTLHKDQILERLQTSNMNLEARI